MASVTAGCRRVQTQLPEIEEGAAARSTGVSQLVMGVLFLVAAGCRLWRGGARSVLRVARSTAVATYNGMRYNPDMRLVARDS